MESIFLTEKEQAYALEAREFLSLKPALMFWLWTAIISIPLNC